jgi:HK97 family phage prohead protease
MYNVKSNYRLKDIDEGGGVISAYVSIFGNIDSDGDMVMPGAFTKTLSERGPGSSKPRIKHLFQHNSWDVIGIPMEMTEDSTGLLVRSKFGSDSYSQDKFKQHQDGLISEFSIGYQNIKTEKVMQDEEVSHYKLIELKLWEYSSVTWGANSLTYTVDIKGNSEDVLSNINDRMDKLTKALRQGKYTDETCEQFEIELKQIQTIYNELIEKQPGETTVEPSTDTLTDEQIREIFKF